MKLHFDNVCFSPGFDLSNSPQSGPNTFANRLANRLQLLGHDIQRVCKNADVSLVFIEPSGSPLAKKIIHRLDGIWFKPDEFKTKNIKIKSMYDGADSIVYQSCFDKQMISSWWGHKNSVVINNGILINQDPTLRLKHDSINNIRTKYDKIFICSANWHPQKRLGSNIELFKHIQLTHPNSCLIVLGNNPNVIVRDPNIYYTGSVGEDVYMQLYEVADWMIHLAYLDHCPNTVIECISQGTPVICSSEGGTKEIVGKYGIIVDENEKYDYRLLDYSLPPHLNINKLKLPATNIIVDKKHIEKFDIDYVAKKYVELFESIV